MVDGNGNGNGTTTIGTGTVDGLLAFLDYLVDKGYATAPAVHPLRVASKIVFSKMQGDGYGSFDVRTFDADDLMDRFERRFVGEYKTESLNSYRQRLKRAVTAYRDFLANGNVSAIRTSARAPRRRKVEESAPATGQTKPNGVRTNGNGNGEGHTPDVSGSLIDYPFPLRSGAVAHLRLPLKLEKADADRLGAFLRTLVFEPQLEIPEVTSEAA
jgi:hypothetical protein